MAVRALFLRCNVAGDNPLFLGRKFRMFCRRSWPGWTSAERLRERLGEPAAPDALTYP